MNINIDANDIIENLTQQVSQYVRENAILKAQIKAMNELIETNQESEDLQK